MGTFFSEQKKSGKKVKLIFDVLRSKAKKEDVNFGGFNI